jgi:predicted alpha/beta hydrolase family esterase
MATKRKVIIAHGWNDSPDNLWISWLAGELKSRGFEVVTPALPRPLVPKLDHWLETLREAVGVLDRNTTLVGYSLGTPTTLRLLNDYSNDVKIAGLVLVAGFGDGILARPGALFNPPLEFDRIMGRAKTRVVIYSDDDHMIPIKRSQHLAIKLGAREVIVMGHGHFMGRSKHSNSIDRLPAALEAVLSAYPRGLKYRFRVFWKSMVRRYRSV